MIGQSCGRIFGEGLPLQVANAVEPVSTKTFLITRDGQRISAEITGCRLSGPQNEGLGFVVSVMPLDESSTAVDALQLRLSDSELKYRTLVESMRDGMLQVDHGDVIQFANDRFCEISGYSREELIGSTGYKLFVMEEYRGLIKQKNLLRQKGVSDRYEIRIKRKSGEPLWIEISGAPVVDSKGAPVGSMAILTDITDRKRAEEILLRLHEDLEQRVRERTAELLHTNEYLRQQIEERTRIEAQLRQTESKFRTLVEQLPGITYFAEMGWKGSWFYVSPQIETLLGFTPEEWMAQPTLWYTQVHPEDRERVLAEEQRCIATKTAFHSDYRLLTKDGRTLWFRDQARIVEDESGAANRFQGILMDVTERKRAVESLLALEKAVEATQLGITITDMEGRIIYTNPAEAKMHGYEKDDLLGKDSRVFSPPDHWRPMSSVEMKEIRSWRRESVNMRRDRTQFPVQLLSDIVVNAEGKPISIFTTCEDITDRKRAEEKMSRFVAGVAHEVRNPLNAIQASVQTLERDFGKDPEYTPLLEVICGQVERLSRLMNELLEIGRPLERYRMQWEPLTPICSSAIELWKQTNKTHRLNLIESDESFELHIDGERMQQVIMNLLDNAAQHSPPGTEIAVSLLRQGRNICMQVKDLGAGVPPEVIPRVFDPFFSKRKGGTGLGLTLVKHIVEAHGGGVSIWNNEPSPGCTVEITIPISYPRETA